MSGLEALRGRRFRWARDLRHAEGRRTVPVAASEFRNLANEVPLLMVRRGEDWDVVALLSPEALRIRLVDEDGRWLGEYAPLLLRLHPFEVTADNRSWYVDPDGTTGRDAPGRDFFGSDGSPAEDLVVAVGRLKQAREGRALLGALAGRLADAGLLAPLMALYDGAAVDAALFAVDGRRLLGTPPPRLAELAAGDPSPLDLALASLYSMRLMEGRMSAGATAGLERQLRAIVGDEGRGRPATPTREASALPRPAGFRLDDGAMVDLSALG